MDLLFRKLSRQRLEEIKVGSLLVGRLLGSNFPIILKKIEVWITEVLFEC